MALNKRVLFPEGGSAKFKQKSVPLNALKCAAQGAAIDGGDLGAEMSFKILTYKSSGGDNLTVAILPLTAVGTPIPDPPKPHAWKIRVEDLQTGSYAVTYQVDKLGKFRIDIKTAEGMHIKNSPLKIEIKASELLPDSPFPPSHPTLLPLLLLHHHPPHPTT